MTALASGAPTLTPDAAFAALIEGRTVLDLAEGLQLRRVRVAAAIGLGLRLWIVGGLIWLIGHIAAVWAAKRDAAFVDVVRRHLRYPQHLVS